MPKLKEELAFDAADMAWKEAKKEGKLSEDALYALEKKRFELHHKWEMAVSDAKAAAKAEAKAKAAEARKSKAEAKAKAAEAKAKAKRGGTRRRRHRTRSTRSTRALTARRR